MDLSLLRGFAAGVRVELVGVVGARLAGVLLPGSVERVEFPEAVRRLEGVVARAGRDVVVDQVAYTWFNRLVALRFMDVNGYTGVGVVSPGGGALVGQPEVLADAKAGHVDAGVVGEKVRDRVIGLLSGSVVSRDGQGEAYKLLLAAYCNHWAGPMPFMFERSGDFTELLVPDDLLSERSIVARVVRTLTPEACADVEVIGWLYQFYIAARKDEVFAGFKKNKKATALEIPAATQLFTPHWIVKYLVENSLGRLWLLNNPGSDLGSRMEYYIAPVEPETDFLKISGPEVLKVLDPACGSGHMLTYAFDLLFLMYEEAGYAPSDIPGLILKHNLFGAEIDPRAGALAAFALVMKARARQKSFLNPGKGAEPNICVLEPVRFTADELETLLTRGGNKAEEIAFWQAFEDADTFGSLIRPNQDLLEPLKAHLEWLGEAQTLFGGDILDRARKVIEQSEYLSTRYHVVVANPPYMGSGNMGQILASRAKADFPDTKSDLFSCFMVRGAELALKAGMLGFMTPMVWMFIAAHRKLREWLLSENAIASLIQLEYSGFEGATVPVCCFVFSNEPNASAFGSYIKLDSFKGHKLQGPKAHEAIHNNECGWFFSVRNIELLAIPGSPIAYWLPEEGIAAYALSSRLSDYSYGQPGLQTSDNSRFIRFWTEASLDRIGFDMDSSVAAQQSGRRWFPHLKGGEQRRWYGNHDYILDWENNGSRIKQYVSEKYPYLNGNIDYVVKDRGYYFKEVLTYNKITSGGFGARYSGSGFLFDVAGSGVFPNEGMSNAVLAFLCSSVGELFVKAQNPTLNVQAGDIEKLPFDAKILRPVVSQLDSLANRAIAISKLEWDSRERSWDFQRNPLIKTARYGETLRSVCLAGEQFELSLRGELAQIETSVNTLIAGCYGLEGKLDTRVDSSDVTLSNYSSETMIKDLISYSVGCIFGRYSVDVPGLVLANQGDSLAEYLAKVPSPSFMPDKDNVLPVLSDAWFEDDIVERFREFLKVSFGVENFEENLRFVEESLGKDIRRYFVQDFYKDHVQRYKKRPIYWMFSSPKGSFNALIYMHRYRPDTVSVVLNDYLHEFQTKLRARRANLDQVAVSTVSTAKEQTVARKESEQIGKMLLELDEWEQSVLYPLATGQIAIDLDDGVKANYPKFGTALKKIVGLEANE